jgi:2,3-bisphosphoglycerate-independent phosphoglycerate mutase
MKYILLVGDGMADYPIKELGDRTPLESAKIPNMNYIATAGQVGLVSTIPKGLAAASDVANLSILGYDPEKYYTGRGPLEAANLGITLEEGEVAFRCNLITAADDKLVDYSAGHISSKEAAVLIKYLNEKLGDSNIKFYAGVSYRHLLVINTKKLGLSAEVLSRINCLPPHDIIGQDISSHLPKGEGADFLIELMKKSYVILEKHDVNHVRVDLKENPANMIWLWGQGLSPKLERFKDKFGLNGSVISAVDLIKGIGKIIGLEVIKVAGATGYYDTDYLGKAKHALDSLRNKDFVFVHVEAPDEAGHNGDLRAKIGAIENFDRLVVGTILKHFQKFKNFRILVLPDHVTPISRRTHTAEPVPFALCGKDIKSDEAKGFNEMEGLRSTLKFETGYQLMEYFIKGAK